MLNNKYSLVGTLPGESLASPHVDVTHEGSVCWLVGGVICCRSAEVTQQWV